MPVSLGRAFAALECMLCAAMVGRRAKQNMRSSSGIQFKTYLSILIIVIFGPVGNVLLSKGMKNLGPATAWEMSDAFPVFLRVFSSPAIWLGIAALITFFVAYTLVLSWADYSFVQPASSIAYGVVALLGYFVLGESVSMVRWLGVIVICVGVFVVGTTPPRTTGRE
jgi:drug/metabolite transporter (DMT)-like permease